MRDEATRIRQAISGLGRGRTTRIPDPIRQMVSAHVKQRRAEGATWLELSEAMGLSPNGLKRIAREGKEPPRRRALVPVAVRPDRKERVDRGFVLVVPNGLRIEGLDLDEAARLLRALW